MAMALGRGPQIWRRLRRLVEVSELLYTRSGADERTRSGSRRKHLQESP